MKTHELTLLICLFCAFFSIKTVGQNQGEITFPNGAKAALCLTYDDGLPSHIHTVAPMLDEYHFKGTFFVTMSATSLREEMDAWKQLAQNGHELANHSVYHPCQKSKAGRDWVKDYLDLDHYTVDQMLTEIQFANTFLQALDGETDRTFAYPCADLHAGGVNFKDSISHYSTAARGVHNDLKPPLEIDLANVPSWAPSGVEGKDLIAYAQSLIDRKTLSTLTFHGVGAEYLIVSNEAHEEMLQWLDAHRDEIWVTTFQEATDYLIKKKKEKR